jgi:hypothetical protein
LQLYFENHSVYHHHSFDVSNPSHSN